MALVAQEPVLFSQTILENIVYGRVGLPQDDIDVALEQASAKCTHITATKLALRSSSL